MIGSAKLGGISTHELWERANQLSNEHLRMSPAWYRAYDELLQKKLREKVAGGPRASVADITNFGPKAQEFTPPKLPVSSQAAMPPFVGLAEMPTLEELKESRSQVTPRPPAPLNSISDVLAADDLNFHALAACLSVDARLAYLDEELIKRNVPKERDEDPERFEVGRTAAFGYTVAGHALLSFRGTEVCELGDWCTDLNMIPWQWPLRHLGFSRAWGRVREQIFEWVGTRPEESRRLGLVLTGHSLGGALALLAAFDLAERFPIRAVITFGAPRVGMFLFRHRYHTSPCGKQTLHAVTRRYTHHTDVVSRVPPPPLYCHVGEEYSVEDCEARFQKGKPVGSVVRFEELLDYLQFKILSAPQKLLEIQQQRARKAPRTITAARVPPGVLRSEPKPRVQHSPAEYSRWERIEEASKAASSQMGTRLWALGHLPVLVLWLVGAGISIWICITGLSKLTSHFSEKYSEAMKERYPTLVRSIDLGPKAV